MKNYKNFTRYISSTQVRLIKNQSDAEKFKEETKMDRLLNGIMSGRYANDTEAAWDLYKTSPKDKGYQMLKSRIKDKLVSHAFQVQTTKVSHDVPYHENALLVAKYVTAGHLMINHGISEEAEKLLKWALQTAKSYQFSGPVVAAARLLRSRAGFKETRKKIEALNKKNKKRAHSPTTISPRAQSPLRCPIRTTRHRRCWR